MKKRNILPLLLLIIFVSGGVFVYSPREVQIESSPVKIIFHNSEEKAVIKVDVEKDSAIYTEIRKFILENRKGWKVVFRQLSLGETAPSIEIFGEENSYELSIWHNEVVVGFPDSGKSYRKKIDGEVHPKLVRMIKREVGATD